MHHIIAALIIAAATAGPTDAAAPGAEEPWWRHPVPVVSHPNSLSKRELRTVNAGAWRTAAYHGGWYGLWDLEAQKERSHGSRALDRLRRVGGRRLLYFDAGEVGDYAAFFTPDGRMEYTGWSVPWWEGEEVTPQWFGLAAFVNDVPWAPYPTARNFDLPRLTRPDGRRADDLYALLTVRGIDGEWQFSRFSNKRVTDEIAEGTGLARISQRQESAPDVRGKSGWVTTRLIHVDHANPRLRDYHCRELERFVEEFRPDGLHIDNLGDLDVRLPTRSGFGIWSLHTFRRYMKEHFSPEELRRMGIDDADNFNLRAYIREKPFDTRGSTWPQRKNPRWATDLIWKCYLISQVRAGLSYHRALHRTAKEAARRADVECAVTGNVIPLFPGAALMKGSCDVAHFEWKAAGQYGHLRMSGLPPKGRLAHVTRLGAAVSQAPYCWPSLYVPRELSGEGHEELHRVLAFDCLANRGLTDYNHWFLDNYSPGTPESAGFVNAFINRHAQALDDRRYLADVGLVYSTWSDIASMTVWGPQQDQFMREYEGWATYLCKTHRQWDVLPAQDLSYEKLGRFPIVVLPSVMALSDRQIDELRRYAERGGRVVATGLSGTRFGPGDHLMPREKNPLERPAARLTTDRPGVRYFKGEDRKKAAARMASLIDFTACPPRLTTDAPEDVGVNLNTAGHGDDTVLSLDLNNYALDVESDTIARTDPFEVTIRLPEALRGRDLSVTHVTAVGPSHDAPAGLPEGSVARDRKAGTLTLRVPAFRYYLIAFIRPAGPRK